MFEGLKIIEFASVLAGPMVGSFFSELGAEVVKIENKMNGGDLTRKWKLPSESKHEISAYYASANYNKTVIMLNLRDENDYKIALQEINKADIVLVNFKFGDAEKFKLDYHTLQKINPLIIYGEINGYGKSNSRTAFDVVLQAETGFMFMNGNATSGPIKMPVALIDILAAHQLKEGLLCALIKKLKQNKGSYVSISLYDAAISSLANQATNWLMNKHIPKAIGTEHPNIAPYGDMFLTKDKKYIVLAVGTDKQFQSLCEKLDRSDILSDDRFLTNGLRISNRSSLNQLLQESFQDRNSEKCISEFMENKIPAGVVKDMQEVFQDPLSNSMLLKENMEGRNTVRVKTVAFKIE